MGTRTEEGFKVVDKSGSEVMKIRRAGLSFGKFDGSTPVEWQKKQEKKPVGDLREGKKLVDTIQFTPQLVMNFD